MKYLLQLLFCLLTTLALSQNDKTFSIVEAPPTWGKEIIHFPIDWAPGVQLEGFEELRFAPQWSNPESEQFWSLVMSWKVLAGNRLPTETIIKNLVAYFDGLMKPNHWADTFPSPSIRVVSIGETETKLVMQFFDGFHTGKTMTVNILATQLYCKTTQKAIVCLKFSINEFEHNYWEKLYAIKIHPNSCLE